MADWRDRRVPEFQAYLRNVLGRDPTERDYAAAVMQLEQRGPGSVAVGHAFRNRIQAEGGDPARHLRHYDPIALGHRWREVTPQAIDKWGAEYDRLSSGEGPLKPGQTHFFSPAGMQAYYNKDPSMVRSAVRMNVPGHGEVLVPNWATKAVAAGDYTNVNGEWFLTPNERYQASDTRTAAATPPPRDAPVAVAAAPTPAPTATTSAPPAEKPSALASLSDYGASALKIANLMSGYGKSRSEAPEQEMQFAHQPIRPANVEFNATVPYMDKARTAMRLARADGGALDGNAAPDDRGAGRFAVPSLMPSRDTYTQGMMDRLVGIGRMPYADGGAVDDTGMNVPETTDSLRAQQRQLIEGRRPAQMFPRGTPELPLPPGMDRVETERGVFHFDPIQITGEEILRASAMGRENEVLGLGPISKDDVMDIVRRTGERPVAITERDPAGSEVRASMATPSTVEMQSDDILRSAAPGHSVDVEPVEDVIGQRGIAGRARGGGISGPLYGATGGRADKVPATARSGSHVLPADIVSHMGQGNTNAGLKALERMFKTGPYGVGMPRRRADGGGVGSDEIPVMLSDGEFVVPPEVVAELGAGDVALGHDVIDAWIMDERKRAIDTIAALPPPATD